MRRLNKIIVYFIFLILVSCATSDITKPEYQFGDKSDLQAVRWGGLIRQDLDFSCGLTSVATILKYHFGEKEVTEKSLLAEFIKNLSEEELSAVFSRGASLAQLGDLLENKGYTVRNWRLEINKLRQVTSSLPVIVYLEKPDFRHFAVVRGVSDYQVSLADPSRGNVKMSIASFLAEWKGRRALLVARNTGKLKQALLFKPDPKEADARTEMLRSIILDIN
jgi:predicted double-glycine peptidase